MNLETWLTKEKISYRELGSILGISTQAVSNWFVGVAQVSPELVWKIYDLTKGEVLPSEMRPDLYPEKPLKRIYGCYRCWNKSPKDYKKWFHSLEEATLQAGNKAIRRSVIRKGILKKQEQDTEEQNNV